MNVIIATGLRGELLFNSRRVSRDEYITDDIIRLTDGKLTVKNYSAKLFSRYPSVILSDEPLTTLSDGEWCFVEDTELSALLPLTDVLVIYNFNRTYPEDVKFDTPPTKIGFCQIEVTEFAGHSHDKITRTIYKRQS
ncbi:MAG: hypothetical protein IJY69_04340 [Clostridia bacterium]|nr:hypothetical protein [Clostridia bacterium]